MISRFIWVWPEWDREEHEEEGDHSIQHFQLGQRTYYPQDGKPPFKQLCCCSRVTYRNTDQILKDEEWECWDQDPEVEIQGPKIMSQDCEPVLHGVMETVNERTALELIKKGDWLKEDEKILLDIDEDYFGCECSIMPLLNSGLVPEDVFKLSEMIGMLLCVNQTKDEIVADSFFSTIIDIVVGVKKKMCEPSWFFSKGTDCLTEEDANRTMMDLLPDMIKSLHNNLSRLLCHEKAVDVLMKGIVKMLFSLTLEQLKALQYVGLCLITAPTNLQFEQYSTHVCHGPNIPGEEMAVILHSPSYKETEERAQLLKKLLVSLPVAPSLVTVCRSMRDGYTPWAQFELIEKSVLDGLDTAFLGVDARSYHYDENLLGGKNGWPNRQH